MKIKEKTVLATILITSAIAASTMANTVDSVVNGIYTNGATWSDGLAPAAGNDYVITNSVKMVNNEATTLAGDSIRIDSGYFRWELTGTAQRTLTASNLQLNGGALQFTGNDAGKRNYTLANKLTVSSSSTLQIGRAVKGKYDSKVTLAQGIDGGGDLKLLSMQGNSENDWGSLFLNEADSLYTGNWTVESGDDGSADLRANAANALGSGTVTLGTKGALVADAANGLDSLGGVTLSEGTSLLSLDNAWNNDTAVLTMDDGTINLFSNTVSTIGSMTIGGNSVNAGTYTATQLTDLGFGGTFNGTGTLTVIPEPATMGMVLAAGTSLIFIRRRLMI